MIQQSTMFGSVMRVGIGAPPGDLGNNGDYYQDTTNVGFYYGPKTNGSWGSPISNGELATLTAANTSVVIGGSGGALTIKANTLDVVAADGPPAAAWSNNSQKITSVANGSGAQDAAAFGQIPLIDATATDIQPLGTLGAGSTGKVADAGHTHPAYEWMPSDQGLVAWNYDPSSAGTTFVPTTGVNGYIFLTGIILREAATVTNIVYGLSGAQLTGLTSNANFVGLYNSSGTLLASSADQTTIWSTAADQKVNVIPLLSPFPEQLAAGRYYVAFLFNGVVSGAALNFKATGGGTTSNAGQTGASMRYGVITGTATSLTNVTLSSMTTPAPFNSQWVGLS